MSPSSTTVVPLGTCDKLFPRSLASPGPRSKGVQHWKQGGNPRSSPASPSHHLRRTLATAMPAPLWAPLRPFCTPGTRCPHKNNETVQAFFPRQGQRQAEPWSTVPGSAGAIGGQQMSERGRGRQGRAGSRYRWTRTRQARAGRGGSRYKQLVGRAAADKEQPWIGKEEAAMRRKHAGMSKKEQRASSDRQG